MLYKVVPVLADGGGLGHEAQPGILGIAFESLRVQFPAALLRFLIKNRTRS